MQKELAEIVHESEKYEKEQLEESDIEVGEGLDGEEEEQSDPEDDVPLATLQTTWRPAAPPTVRAFTEATGPSHTLPENAKPLDYFFLFLPQSLFVTIAEETNRYADQKIAARGTPDPLWEKTTPAEMRAYLSVLTMMGVKRQPRLWCYWSSDPRFTGPWIRNVMPKTRFFLN